MKQVLPLGAQFSRLGSELPRLLPTQRIFPDRNRIAPPRSYLQPEDGSRHRLAAVTSGDPVKIAGDLRIGLDVSGVELGPEVFAQGLAVIPITTAMSVSGMPQSAMASTI
jgi:hypothetical protein